MSFVINHYPKERPHEHKQQCQITPHSREQPLLTHKSTDSTRVYARLTNHATRRTVDFISDKVSILLKGAEQANDTSSGPKGAGNDNNTLVSKMLAAIMQVMEEHQGNEGGQQPG